MLPTTLATVACKVRSVLPTLCGLLALGWIRWIFQSSAVTLEHFVPKPYVKSYSRAETNVKTFQTVGDTRRLMQLPCNYVHDGRYIEESNEVLHQVYQTLTEFEDEDIVPVFIEVGGHDGITKSISLKSSVCLHVNTILIEASRVNYQVLERARPRDTTIHAALCEEGTTEIQLAEDRGNTGKSHVTLKGSRNTYTVPCTTLDQELDRFAQALPAEYRNKVQLVFLVLDIEGFEVTALKGLSKYHFKKAMIETKQQSRKQLAWLKEYTKTDDAVGCNYFHLNEQDTCYNFHPEIRKSSVSKELLYTARSSFVPNNAKTSVASKHYWFYGQQ